MSLLVGTKKVPMTLYPSKCTRLREIKPLKENPLKEMISKPFRKQSRI